MIALSRRWIGVCNWRPWKRAPCVKCFSIPLSGRGSKRAAGKALTRVGFRYKADFDVDCLLSRIPLVLPIPADEYYNGLAEDILPARQFVM
jgi:hypothetical protein